MTERDAMAVGSAISRGTHATSVLRWSSSPLMRGTGHSWQESPAELWMQDGCSPPVERRWNTRSGAIPRFSDQGRSSLTSSHGGVAQLVERLTGSQEVRGFEPHRLHSKDLVRGLCCGWYSFLAAEFVRALSAAMRNSGGGAPSSRLAKRHFV
jgi:hypothetical protein